MNFEFACTIGWMVGDIPHQLWEAQTALGNASPLVTRFLFNKVGFYFNNFLRCYLSYFSFDYILINFTGLGLLAFISGVYFAWSNHKFLIITLLIVAPLFPLMEIPKNIRIRELLFMIPICAVMFYGIVCCLKSLKRKS